MDYEERLKLFESEVKPHIPDKLYQYLLDNGFLTQSASTSYHGCYAGGLFDHSLMVMKNLLTLTEKLNLKWQNPNSPYLIGIAHDICKLDAYIEQYGMFVWNKNQSYPKAKHGIKSVYVLRDILGENVMTDEEESCIAWHMGAFTDKEDWGHYTQGIKDYPNVLWTHTADIMSTHINNI